jgi:hypothetical protein
MKNKKEFPRKRKRFIKKIIFYSSFLIAIGIVFFGIAFYSLWSKFQKPLFVSPLPSTQIAQADQGEIIIQKIEEGMRKKQIEFQSVERQSDSYIITLKDNSKVTFSSQKDIMLQIASLQYILSHLTMEGRQFSSLDLRFDQPVIVLKP